MSNQEEDSKGNTNVNLSGLGITSKVIQTQDSTIQAPSSDVFVDSSSLLRVNVRECNIFMQNSTQVFVTGSKNSIHGDHIIKSRLCGQGNTVAGRNITSLVLSGSQNVCELNDEDTPSIFGNGNYISAGENSNLVVSGNGNSVMAENNKNLKVQGSVCKVVACQTRNITVDGQLNNVMVRSTTISHQLKRINTGIGIIPESKVDFCGSPISCLVYPGVIFPTTLNFHINLNNETEYESSNDSDLPQVLENDIGVDLKLARMVIPQISIQYIDRISIKGNYYIIGIFHFQVNSFEKPLPKGDSSSSSVKVLIILEKLDNGSFCWAIDEKGKNAVIGGNKNGHPQMLTLMGDRVAKCDDLGRNVFIIDLHPPRLQN